MGYADAIRAQGRAAERPIHHADLLFEPITDNPPGPQERSYAGWEAHHGDRRRFYVGGFVQFLQTGAATNGKALHEDFAAAAVETAQQDANWTSMLGARDQWAELSYNQVRHVRNGVPMFFQKAALIILACELALDAALEAGMVADTTLASGAEVYRFMSVIPACWNVDDFNEKHLERLRTADSDIFAKLRDATGQPEEAIRDLASGATVTRATASACKAYIDETYPDLRVGRVRARPGRKLGRGHASAAEDIDRG